MIRGIGLRGAIAVNVITMIGIGPLITIPLVLNQLHGSLALAAWIAGARLFFPSKAVTNFSIEPSCFSSSRCAFANDGTIDPR